MMPVPSAREVVVDPSWIPYAFESDGQLTFVFVPRPARDELMFLTEGHLKDNFPRATLPRTEVAAQASSAPQAPIHFIFHTSFSCSTLLARALEIPAVATALREPNIVVSLATWMASEDEAKSREKLDLSVRLLARPFEAGEKVVVKASSFGNRVLDPLLATHPLSRVLLLYSDPATFLRSVARRGMWGRINARRLYQSLIGWTRLDFGFSPQDTMEQTDLQIAALAWLMQIAHFNSIAREFGPERAIMLNGAELIASPAATLERLQPFFQLNMDSARIRDIASGPVFAKHSKFRHLDYDSTARDEDHRALMEVHGDEIAMVLQWLTAVAAHTGVALPPVYGS